jgi:hypothetical protein
MTAASGAGGRRLGAGARPRGDSPYVGVSGRPARFARSGRCAVARATGGGQQIVGLLAMTAASTPASA